MSLLKKTDIASSACVLTRQLSGTVHNTIFDNLN